MSVSVLEMMSDFKRKRDESEQQGQTNLTMKLSCCINGAEEGILQEFLQCLHEEGVFFEGNITGDGTNLYIWW